VKPLLFNYTSACCRLIVVIQPSTAAHQAKSAARSRELASVCQPAADLSRGSRHRL